MNNEMQMVHVQDAFVPENIEVAPPDGGGGGNPLAKVHQCLRGRYLKAITTGILLGAIGASVAYFLVPLKYTSIGQIHIRQGLERVLPSSGENTISNYESFVQTQVMLLTNASVVRDAVTSPAWKALRDKSPSGSKTSDEEIVDFTESLDIYHPAGTEIILVKFRDADPQKAYVGANAVIDAYTHFADSFATDNFPQRLQALNEEQNRLLRDIEACEKRIEVISKEFYSADLPTIRLRVLSTLQELDYRIGSVDVMLASLLQLTEATSTRPAPADLTTELAERLDPKIHELRLEKDRIIRQINNLHVGPNSDTVKGLNAQMTEIQVQINERMAALKERYEKGDDSPEVSGPTPLLSREQLQRQKDQLLKLREAAANDLKELSQQQRDIDSNKSQIEIKRGWLNDIRTTITRENLERPLSTMEHRITKYPANQPFRPDKDRRIAAAAGGGLGGLAIGMGIFALLGFFDRRLRSVADARESLDRSNRILGVLPYLPEDLSDPQQSDSAAFCVHHIRTLLQVGGSGSNNPAIAITSASPGDGKTSLVISLGLSYAATGLKTLLIDSDLIGAGLTSRANAIARRKIGSILLREKRITQKQLDEALDSAVRQGKRLGEILLDMGYIKQSELDKALSLQQESNLGLLDVLDGEPLADCVSPGWTDNLFVLPVGNVRANHAGQISLRAVRRIIAEARAHYDVVLVDTGPILGSLEACIIAAAVDEVIVAVARDQQRSLVERTFSRLREVGARVAGIVFNRAPREDVESGGYSSAYSSQRLQSPDVRDEAKSSQLQRLGPIVRAVAGGGGKGNPPSSSSPGEGL